MSFDGIEIDHLSWQEVESAYKLIENSPNNKITIKAGELVAVCGPAGSGKSALIHLIAGSNISKGKVKVHGSMNLLLEDGIYSDKKKRCSYCWFDHSRIVPHADYIIPTLKCKQYLDISLELHGSTADTLTRLDLMKLRPCSESLLDKFDHQRGLSSRGNLKKLSILQALSGRPSVLLVDEPAYLVDLKKMLDIVKGLKKYSKEEFTPKWTCEHCGMDLRNPSKTCVIFAFSSIILSLKWRHSLIEYFDKIILMSSSKQIIFFGTISEAISTIGRGSIERLLEALEDVSLEKRVAPDFQNLVKIEKRAHKSKYTIPWYKQIWVLIKRHWYQVRNTPVPIIRVILQRIFLFITLSFIFAEPKSRASFSGVFFFLPINQTANVLLFTVTEGFLPTELIIIQHARFSKTFKSWTLLISKLLILTVINILPALFYLPALFFIADFKTTSNFGLYFLANLLQIAATVPLGIFIASTSKNYLVRDLWLFGATTVLTTFGGFHTSANFELSWIIRWIQYLSPTYYLFCILLQLEYSLSELEITLNLGQFVLSTGEAMAALVALGVLYFILACISINRSTKPSRILF